MKSRVRPDAEERCRDDATLMLRCCRWIFRADEGESGSLLRWPEQEVGRKALEENVEPRASALQMVGAALQTEEKYQGTPLS